MNRRDLFKYLGVAFAAPVLVDDGITLMEHPIADRGPYNTDDPFYDELLDEMLGEEWS